MATLIIADNQDITRFAVSIISNQSAVFDMVIEVTNKKDLVSHLLSHPYALVVLDYTTFDINGSDELLILGSRFTTARWILFSENLSEDFLKSIMFASDNFSVVLKDSSIDEIRTSFSEVNKGNRYVCKHVVNLLLNQVKKTNVPIQSLTPVEQEILREMALGHTTKEIANLRHVSTHTVMTHRKNIFRKLEVNNVHEATKCALRMGVIDMAEYYI